MSLVVTLERYRPIARYDGLPWTLARLYEGTSSAGPWTLLNTFPLSPLDPDPTDPQSRSFTTELATGPNLWYQIVFVDASGDVSTATAAVQNTSEPNRDLCTFMDVMSLVPGYDFESETDQLITELITAESRTAHESAGREFMAVPFSTTRSFDVDERMARQRIVPVGDMTTVTTVTVQDVQGTAVGTVAGADYVKLPRNREEWEPIVELWFPKGTASPAPFGTGSVLSVVGVWGFPSVPSDVKMAVAKLVLVRYLADAASTGTALADTLNEQSFDVGQAFASAMDVLRAYQPAVFV